jgi:flavin reductase (DIM6/NTAB) family NADH-FMN oxidoreductase RutF
LIRDTSFDQREFRNALGRFATGIAVITTIGPGGKVEGMTANSFGALSLDPPMVHWCIGKSTLTHDIFCRSDHFAINVLRASQRHLSNNFANPAKDKFSTVNWKPGIGGVPLLENPLALFECRNSAQHDSGDHTILIGAVENFSYIDGHPLLFSAGKYAVAADYPDDQRAMVDAKEFSDLSLYLEGY